MREWWLSLQNECQEMYDNFVQAGVLSFPFNGKDWGQQWRMPTSPVGKNTMVYKCDPTDGFLTFDIMCVKAYIDGEPWGEGKGCIWTFGTDPDAAFETGTAVSNKKCGPKKTWHCCPTPEAFNARKQQLHLRQEVSV
jgi:hypothetical protein